MEDRELLELAAKAAGYTSSQPVYPQGIVLDTKKADGERIFWNPLTDDGDALRLAVKLRMRISIHDVLHQTLVNPGSPREIQENWEDHNHDIDAATRRAIVRAAAQLGAEHGTK